MRKTFGVAAVLVLCAVSGYAQEVDQTIVASDKKTQITVPSSWSVMELNDAAEIQVGNEKDDAYIVVLNEAKDDLYGWNLDKHSRVTLGRLLASITFPEIVGPKTLTIGGRPAVQYEIRGASQNRKVIYIHTTVDGAKHFSQIMAWTLPSHFDTVRPQLIKAIESFHEVPEKGN